MSDTYPTVMLIPQHHSARTLVGTMRWLRADSRRRVVVDSWLRSDFDFETFRAWFVERLMEKINRDERPRGRKDSTDWWRSMSHVARSVNTPRLRVHASSVPLELRSRLAHRLTQLGD